jgi:ATP-dependent phosphofructokinase / diphosphate-dependent phosphofructokinase
MGARRNVVVAQSGGPSPVINASLQGVIEACADFPDRIGKVYAAWHGVEGILTEELMDMSRQPREEIGLLRKTPAAGYVGTCRYKLSAGQDEDFARIVEVLRAHDVGWFFYIGGNDSMDTAHKVALLARDRGVEVVCTGVPKTIDNDVGDQEFRLTDHTPGYGSAARYWASIVLDVDEENRGMCPSEPVTVLQAMGRKAGFIPAASRLGDPERRIPLQLYLAEAHHTLESLAENVNREVKRSGRCIVVASEGFDVGTLGEARDGFGHIEYGASRSTVAQVIVNYLNESRIAARGNVTGQVPGVLQRSTSAYLSPVDVEEAYQVGRKAVELGVREGKHDGTGFMATILRRPGTPYRAFYDKVPLEAVANSARVLPPAWLSADGLDVTDAFLAYARPLIGDGPAELAYAGGVPRFARLVPASVPRKLPTYVPVRHRG